MRWRSFSWSSCTGTEFLKGQSSKLRSKWQEGYPESCVQQFPYFWEIHTFAFSRGGEWNSYSIPGIKRCCWWNEICWFGKSIKGRLGRIRALKQVLSYEFSSLDLVIGSFLFSRSVRGVINSFYSHSIPQPGWGSSSRYNKEKALCLGSIPKELIVIRRRTFLLASSEWMKLPVRDRSFENPAPKAWPIFLIR